MNKENKKLTNPDGLVLENDLDDGSFNDFIKFRNKKNELENECIE